MKRSRGRKRKSVVEIDGEFEQQTEKGRVRGRFQVRHNQHVFDDLEVEQAKSPVMWLKGHAKPILISLCTSLIAGAVWYFLQ